MARNLYILAATLLAFSVISCGMAMVGSVTQPGLPAEGSLWKTVGLFLLLGSLGVALMGTLTALFEQVDRRSEERRLQARRRGHRP